MAISSAYPTIFFITPLILGDSRAKIITFTAIPLAAAARTICCTANRFLLPLAYVVAAANLESLLSKPTFRRRLRKTRRRNVRWPRFGTLSHSEKMLGFASFWTPIKRKPCPSRGGRKPAVGEMRLRSLRRAVSFSLRKIVPTKKKLAMAAFCLIPQKGTSLPKA